MKNFKVYRVYLIKKSYSYSYTLTCKFKRQLINIDLDNL